MLPEYWLQRPGEQIDERTRSVFDRILTAALDPADNRVIDDTLPAPKWQFLCHAAEHHDLALHGSGNPDITIFEPRQPVDLNAFGNRKAVYAAADGIWAMFFAILDRDRFRMTLNNACIRLVDREGKRSEPYYFFSVSKPALARQPWRSGTVYLLPRATFEAQPPIPFGEALVQSAQLASLSPVRPLARLMVAPGDFPFLHRVVGHDDAQLEAYAAALQTGGPLPG